MNCSRFRFLIQRKFDENLGPSDDSQLLAHIESCPSCTRFFQQMEKLVQTASDLTLPEDAVPENLESLARLIMQQLPAQKVSVFSFFENLFSKNKAAAKPAINKPASHFPHVKRQQEQAQTGSKVKMVDDQQATSARLKSISRLTGQHAQAKPDSEVRSLGESLGLSMPQPGQEEGPLNLAETIRRKVTEEQKVVPSPDGAFARPEPGAFAVPPVPPVPQDQSAFNDFSNWDTNSAPQGGAWTEAPEQEYAQDPWGQKGSAAPPAESDAASGFAQSGFEQAAPSSQSWNESAPFNASQTSEVPQAPEWSPSTTAWGSTQAASAEDAGQTNRPAPQEKAWSEDAEQVQTGFWQAFNLNEEGLGAPQTKPTAQAPGGNFAQGMPQQNNVITPPSPAQQAQAADDRWDVPIQQRLRQNEAELPVEAASPPAPLPESFSQPASAQPVKADSLMDRLSNILGDSPAQPSVPPAPPILEKLPEPGVELAQAEETKSRSAHYFTEPEFEPIAEPFTSEPQAQSLDPSRFETPIQQRQSAQQQDEQASGQGLFKNIDQQEIDRLFADNLGLNDAAKKEAVAPSAVPPPPLPLQPAPIQQAPVPPPQPVVSQPVSAPLASNVPPPPVPSMPQAPLTQPASATRNMANEASTPPIPPPQQLTPDQGGGLLGNLDDSAIDQLFADHLGVDEQTKPVGRGGGGATQAASPSQAQAQPIASEAASSAPPQAPAVALQAGLAAPQAPVWAPETPSPGPIPSQPAAAEQPKPAPSSNNVVVPPPPVPEISAVPEAPATAAQPAAKGLFSIDDDALDKIFADNLGVQDSASNKQPSSPSVSTQVPAPPTVPQAQEAVNQAPAAPFIEPIQPAQEAFNQAPVPPVVEPFQPAQERAQAPAVPEPTAAQSQAPIESKAPSSQEAKAAPATGAKPPKVEGMGRLDRNTEAPAEVGSGRISSIGKFLLDQQDLVKLGEFTSADMTGKDVRVLTTEANEELQTLLSQISSQSGVIGSVIVGHDGIIIANNLPSEVDPESIGVWGLGIFLNTDNAIKKMGHNQIHQVVTRSLRGYVVIADFGGGILVTVSDSPASEALLPLMRCITQLVAS
jgi:predicted regulator of Ras-like GTPase activity (Roadblock/LC7/MglB family)